MSDTQLPTPYATHHTHYGDVDYYTADQMRAYAAEAVRAALAAQGEPVGEVFTMEALGTPGKPFCHVLLNRTLPTGTKLYTAAPAKPMTESDTVQVYGIKDGKQTLLGTAPTPARMKARELAREQFGYFEDGDGSDAELCFGALEQLIDHIERSAHHGITAKGGA